MSCQKNLTYFLPKNYFVAVEPLLEWWVWFKINCSVFKDQSFFAVVLISLNGHQLVYLITSFDVCQPLFSFFSKFFLFLYRSKLWSFRKHFPLQWWREYSLYSLFGICQAVFQIFQICSAFFVPLSSLFPDDKILLYTVFDRSQHFFSTFSIFFFFHK